MKNILDVAKELGLSESSIIPYGWDKAKIDYEAVMTKLKDKSDGKWVVVSAIEPTKAGEGKTTTAIGLHDGLRTIGVNSMLCLRQGSLGPTFGVKGNAIGNGKSKLIPENDLSLHFTGDLHALTSAINLISAVIENHIYQGNELNIDPNKIVWKRAVDMNDRSLRSITVAQNDKKAIPHKSEYVITVASELMSVWCLATTAEDFKKRANNMLIAYTYDNKPIYLRDLKMSNSIELLMRDALNPNLVQTVEGNPVLVHSGPFCNISIGTNSIRATKLALKLSDVVIQEFGFGGSLGMEKALNVVAQVGNLKPAAVVLVATIKGLKSHGGQAYEDLATENIEALKLGVSNLECHIDNAKKFGVPFVIAINKFTQDSKTELTWLENWCTEHNYPYALSTAVVDGAKGAEDLAKVLVDTLQNSENTYKPLYNFKDSIYSKIDVICKEVYGATGVAYTDEAKQQIDSYIAMGYNDLPICMAKTPLSISADPKLLGRPTNFIIPIREVRLASGAGFIIPLCGDVMMMPGLNKNCKALDEFAQLK